jgi:hypothetical protein
MFGVVGALKDTEALLINLSTVAGSSTIEKAASDVTWAIERLGTITRELALKEKECNGKTDDSKILDEFEERLAARRAGMTKKQEEHAHSEDTTKPPVSFQNKAVVSAEPEAPTPEPETSPAAAPVSYGKPTFPTDDLNDEPKKW